MEAVGCAAIKQVGELILDFLKEHLGYMISSNKHVNDMLDQMTELEVLKCGVEQHKKQNIERRREVPAIVIKWLEEVQETNERVKNVATDVGTCFPVYRHTLGVKALEIIKKIKSLKENHSLILWIDHPIPLGRVDTIMASTYTPSSDHHNGFPSRDHIFTEALKALSSDNASQMIALCGMGGVGKTTIVEELRKVVAGRKMFDYIVKVVVGEKPDLIAIQQTVARYLGIELKESTKSENVDKLRIGLKAKVDVGMNKLLVIMDDVWHSVDLEDIGLSPPIQGVHFKVLLTSRKKDVCTEMGVEANNVLNVGILEEEEAQRFFRELNTYDDADPQLHKIGEDIVRKCGGLPIAIKTMACTLRGKCKDAWKNALVRLEHHDNVEKKVFQISYDNLQDAETKSVFLMCGLYPEDFNIPTEELVRYGWGLKTFKHMSTVTQARNSLNTCIEQLINANLLLKSDDTHGCVKMHDLVLDFVLSMFSEEEHASIVKHGSMSGWPEIHISSSSCKSLSLTCRGMPEFPTDIKFPNLSFLKLMDGRTSLKFPQDFYGEMEKLQVISYDNMSCSLLQTSPQCSTNLRVLHLHKCSLKFDCSFIGDLLNLEVLSFANSKIKWLPSRIGNLKKLRLLDLTNCYGLRVDNGVLKNLVKLEEIYALASYGYGYLRDDVISFTSDDRHEMAKRSKNLSALEFIFFENNSPLKNMSFENLERFKITVGRSISGIINKCTHSFQNTLDLFTSKDEILETKIYELFEKTEELCLSVDGMNNLEDIAVKSLHPLQFCSFYNLRNLVVWSCADLAYLFTLGAAKALSTLEHLQVYHCYNMKALIHSEGGGEETISFPKLKLLSLTGLPQLASLKLEDLTIVTSIFSQNKLDKSSLFSEVIVVPMLEKLEINDMKNLKEIWPCDFSIREEGKLRRIAVNRCPSLVNIFPCNPMPLLHHLEELQLWNCGSIEALFEIDLDSLGETGEGNSSSLRSIKVDELCNLRQVWRIKGESNSHHLIPSFQAIESIEIKECMRFRRLWTPTTISFDLGALVNLKIIKNALSWKWKSSQEEEIDIVLKKEASEVIDIKSNIAFPSCLTHSFHNLRTLVLRNYEGVEVVFEIESPTSRELTTTHHNQQRLLPYLEELDICDMDIMSHVWKCNWNKFLILQKQPSESPFHNLTTIRLVRCSSIKYLFSPLMAKLLSNLRKVEMKGCSEIEEVVSNRDDEDEEKTTFSSTSTHTSTTLFPHLDSLTLYYLDNLKCIGGGGAKDGNNEVSFNETTTSSRLDQFKFPQVGGVSWSLCQYAREIKISCCDELSSVIPCYAAGQRQKLQVLSIHACSEMKEIFETQVMNSKNKSDFDEENSSTPGISRINNVIMLPNLKILNIFYCICLEHVFTFSTLESLRQLEELTIRSCLGMKVIVKGEDDKEQTSSKEVVVFPRLKSVELEKLPELEGFFLGENEFRWPSLDKVTIYKCPKMRVFAPGGSTTPLLKYVHKDSNKYNVEECGLNTHHVTTAAHNQTPFPSSCPATSEGMPLSSHNLIELLVYYNNVCKKIITSNELLQLQKLEKIEVRDCDLVQEVFEALEGGTNSSGFDESQTTLLKLPNLTQVDLSSLDRLRHIWKSNQWTTFEFPNLTTVNIQSCRSLKHVFTSSMAGSLLQLQELYITDCCRLEEVISKDTNVGVEEEDKESDGKMNEIIMFPRLKSLTLGWLDRLRHIWKSNQWTTFEFPNLTTVAIDRCNSLEHVFTSSMAGSLLQLQELHIRNSDQLKEVIAKDTNVGVEEEEKESDGKMNEIIKFPRLKSLKLKDLSRLKGFCLGKEDFSFPLLDTLEISDCPAITTFTNGNSATPELKEIETKEIETGYLESVYAAGEDINSIIKRSIKRKSEEPSNDE